MRALRTAVVLVLALALSAHVWAVDFVAGLKALKRGGYSPACYSFLLHCWQPTRPMTSLLARFAIYAAVLLLVQGCASILEGTDQTITVETSPMGAICRLYREGIVVGQVITPGGVVVEKTKHDMTVECEKEGYEVGKANLESGVEGATWGNILAGGGIGWAIDSAAGADNKYPEYVNIILVRTEVARAEVGLEEQQEGIILEPPKSERMGSGSGFIVSDDSVVLTNHHVVDECGTLQVGHGRSEAMAQGRVIASDRTSDLALVRTKESLGPSATFRHGRGIRPGDDIVVMGFPLHGLLASEASVTKGTVSALAGPGDDRRMVQITAPVQPGSSGGPVFDMSGNVVGIVVAKLRALKIALTTGDIPQNVNFAINAAVARTFLDTHGVDYQTAESKAVLSAADIASRARQSTVRIECWR